MRNALVCLLIIAAACGPMTKHAPPCSADLDPGDLVITEVFADSADGADADKEWFEIFNNTGDPIELEGLVITASRPGWLEPRAARDARARDRAGPILDARQLEPSRCSSVRRLRLRRRSRLAVQHRRRRHRAAMRRRHGRSSRLRQRQAGPLARVHRRAAARRHAQRRSRELVRRRRDRVHRQKLRHAGDGQRLPTRRRRLVRRQRHVAPGGQGRTSAMS